MDNGWGPWQAAGYQAQGLPNPLTRQIAKQAYRLQQLGVTKTSLHWCPGHSKVPGNELADKISRASNEVVLEQQ
ncbi:hypothetical protein P280DRAFT_51469 [Massarina eburnea CBS 473.64]|uniref:Uncharacterized protein n=1 Tax=Massarina eburnea CBS 473.64 TaxID=1395130 RepID=A0A6A6RXH1_9PLEO|nr:hypothetical protein P280DRAFT_51469 [Massarina eburnea CBS 473.64]